MQVSQQSSKSSTFRILVTTDNHLGFKENDPIRGLDTFKTFEEILDIGVHEQVDFMIQSGDLFHKSQPSQLTIYKTMALLESKIFGDQKIDITVKNYQPNYANENLNIGLPIFSIHGNHDPPAVNQDQIGMMDLLKVNNYVTFLFYLHYLNQILQFNYFGKYLNDKFEVEPIIIQKGDSKIALYGIGYRQDRRFRHSLEIGNVTFKKLPDSQSYVNILMIHQNRFKGNISGGIRKDCFHASQFPDFLNLIIWGHEHESIPQLTPVCGKQFLVYQPGSTVITKLCHDDIVPKHCSILEINLDEIKMMTFPLKTCRPLIFQTVTLEDLKSDISSEEFSDEDVENAVVQHLNKMLNQYQQEGSNQSMLPLVRLRIDQGNELNILRSFKIENQFEKHVANPGQILKFINKRRANSNRIDIENDFTNMGQNDFDECMKNKSFIKYDNDTLGEINSIFIQEIGKSGYSSSFFPPQFIQQKASNHVMTNNPNGIVNSINQLSNKTIQSTQRKLINNLPQINQQFFTQLANLQTPQINQPEPSSTAFRQKMTEIKEQVLQQMQKSIYKQTCFTQQIKDESELQENRLLKDVTDDQYRNKKRNSNQKNLKNELNFQDQDMKNNQRKRSYEFDNNKRDCVTSLTKPRKYKNQVQQISLSGAQTFEKFFDNVALSKNQNQTDLASDEELIKKQQLANKFFQDQKDKIAKMKQGNKYKTNDKKRNIRKVEPINQQIKNEINDLNFIKNGLQIDLKNNRKSRRRQKRSKGFM